ncbi:MAG: thymidylate synthase, partial [Gemmatimonadetes bacterium]|nr:thymidylate synthase [Gemmatimonadota bacterium]
MLIWRPWDNGLSSKDIPCTIQFQFLVRDGRLNMITTMRSNDVFWGLPYDEWMFTNVQFAVAYALNMDVGWYQHNTGSLDAYVDRDMEALNALHAPDGSEEMPPPFV